MAQRQQLKKQNFCHFFFVEKSEESKPSSVYLLSKKFTCLNINCDMFILVLGIKKKVGFHPPFKNVI